MKLLIIGLPGTTHIGGTFLKVAHNLHLNPKFINVDLAYQAPKWLKTINWHLRGRYPSNLNTFSQDIVKQCINLQPQWLLTTGIAAVNHLALQQIGEMGIQRLNFQIGRAHV